MEPTTSGRQKKAKVTKAGAWDFGEKKDNGSKMSKKELKHLDS